MSGAKAGREVVVEARDLTKSYGYEDVVKGISFEAREGECLGFLGPNGAGKTSTMKMLYGLTTITAGRANIFGLDVERNLKAVKRGLGVVPQENNLDEDLTVFDNLVVYARYFGISKKEAVSRTAELLQFVQLQEKAKFKITALSGGMKRRLILARSLVNAPRLVILDEPTTGLDPQARHLIWSKLRLLLDSGVTMILTTHYMEEAERLCDRVLIMDEGRILEEGPPAELIEKHAGLEVMEMGLGGRDPAEYLEALDGFPGEYQITPDSLYVFCREECTEMGRRLLELGATDFIRRRASLEDVFLKVAGRELKE